MNAEPLFDDEPPTDIDRALVKRATPARVIVALQDHPLRRTFACYLRRDGHTVDEAIDVECLIQLLCAAPADVVIIDVPLGSNAHWNELLGDAKIIRLRATRADPVGSAVAVVFERPWDMDDVRTAALHLTKDRVEYWMETGREPTLPGDL